MRNMRRHMVAKHNMSQQEVDTVTKKRQPMYYAQIYGDRIVSADEAALVTAAASSSAPSAAHAPQYAAPPRRDAP